MMFLSVPIEVYNKELSSLLTLCTLSDPMDPNTKIYVTEDFFYIDFLNEF